MSLIKEHFLLALIEVFASHWCKSVVQVQDKNNIICCFKPASCTGELQPMDLTISQVLRLELKASFAQSYAGLVKEQLRDGVELENSKPDLSVSILKPLHAHWLIEAFSIAWFSRSLIK